MLDLCNVRLSLDFREAACLPSKTRVLLSSSSPRSSLAREHAPGSALPGRRVRLGDEQPRPGGVHVPHVQQGLPELQQPQATCQAARPRAGVLSLLTVPAQVRPQGHPQGPHEAGPRSGVALVTADPHRGHTEQARGGVAPVTHSPPPPTCKVFFFFFCASLEEKLSGRCAFGERGVLWRLGLPCVLCVAREKLSKDCKFCCAMFLLHSGVCACMCVFVCHYSGQSNSVTLC